VSGRRLRATARRPPPVSVTGATVSGPRPALARAPPPVGATRTTLSGNGQANPGAAARLRHPHDALGQRSSQPGRRRPIAPPARRSRATVKPTRAPPPDCATRATARTTASVDGAAADCRFRHRSDDFGTRPALTQPPPVCAARTTLSGHSAAAASRSRHPDDDFGRRPSQPGRRCPIAPPGRRPRATARLPPPVSVTGATVTGYDQPQHHRRLPFAPPGRHRTTDSGNGQPNPPAPVRPVRTTAAGDAASSRLPFPPPARRVRDTTGPNAITAARLRRPDDGYGPRRGGRLPFPSPERRLRDTTSPNTNAASRFRHRSDGYGTRPAPTPTPPPVSVTGATVTGHDQPQHQRRLPFPSPERRLRDTTSPNTIAASRLRHPDATGRRIQATANPTPGARCPFPSSGRHAAFFSACHGSGNEELAARGGQQHHGLSTRHCPEATSQPQPVVTISQFTVLHVLAPSCLLG
jgi:hypothetical protein